MEGVLAQKNNPLTNTSSSTLGDMMGSMGHNVNGNFFNIGVFYLRPTKAMVNFFGQLLTYRRCGLLEQAVLNCFWDDMIAKGMRLEGLDRDINPFCNPKRDDKAWAYRSIHFCCIYPGSPENKKAVMKAEGYWLL